MIFLVRLAVKKADVGENPAKELVFLVNLYSYTGCKRHFHVICLLIAKVLDWNGYLDSMVVYFCFSKKKVFPCKLNKKLI